MTTSSKISGLDWGNCSLVKCYLQDKPHEVLFDTRVNVSIISEDELWKLKVPIKNLKELLHGCNKLLVRQGNQAEVPYKGWTQTVI